MLSRFSAWFPPATDRKKSAQTCGDLHMPEGDGSVLTVLGWSPQFAFDYTWLPRRFFTGP